MYDFDDSMISLPIWCMFYVSWERLVCNYKLNKKMKLQLYEGADKHGLSPP